MNLKRIAASYLAASVAVIAPSYIASWLLADWGVKTNWLKLAAGAWLCVVGTPSMFYASAQLHKTLGHKPQPQVSLVSGHTVLADAVSWTLGKRQRQSLTMADQLAFRVGPVVLSEADVDTFLRGAWRRQLHNEAPLSRRYWLARGRMDREQYDAIVTLMQACNLIRGARRQGSKNRLRFPPYQTLRELRHRYSPGTTSTSQYQSRQ